MGPAGIALFVTALSLARVSVVAQPSDETPAFDAAFAFANEDGDHLLTLGEIAAPGRLTRAVCGGGKDWPARWVRRQESTPRDPGRQTAANFERIGGHLFQLSGRVEADAVCLLVAETFDRARTLRPVDARGAACDEATRARLAAARGREVAACRDTATIDGRVVVLVEFARRGNELLASLCLFGPEGVVFHDYPADWDEERISCWRVDDGCQFEPEAISILFGHRTAAGLYGLAVAWAGFEGPEPPTDRGTRNSFPHADRGQPLLGASLASGSA